MRKGNVFRKAVLGMLAGAAALTGTSANAITIVLHDIGGVTGSPAEQGFRIAAAYWSSVLTNNATINLDVGFSSLGTGILGQTGSNLIEYVPIQTYYTALGATGNSALDQVAVSHLSPLTAGSVTAVVPGYKNATLHTGIDNETSRVAPLGQPISNTIALTTANAKALGLATTAGQADGEVQFSSTFAFDFDPTNGISAGTYDFIGVAVHEIGHALGFVSGADDFDYSGNYTGPVDNAWWGYGLDMFRYSANGAGDGPVLDWTPGTASYFSIDGGVTPFHDGYFSTGENYGDGNQASHWKEPTISCGDFRGIMNPYICNGKTDSAEGLDLALFDAIGYNISFDVLANQNYAFSTADMYRAFATAVPEPSSWGLMILGFGLVGGTLRRRSVKVSYAA